MDELYFKLLLLLLGIIVIVVVPDDVRVEKTKSSTFALAVPAASAVL